MPKKVHTRNGFKYHCDRLLVGNQWHTAWFFRPVTAPYAVHFSLPQGRALKADLEALLEQADNALEYYYKDIARQADVGAAEAALEAAQRRHEHLNSPDYDPGGNTNNPGRVKRAIREVNQSSTDVKRAEEALEHAKKMRASLSITAKSPTQ